MESNLQKNQKNVRFKGNVESEDNRQKERKKYNVWKGTACESKTPVNNI